MMGLPPPLRERNFFGRALLLFSLMNSAALLSLPALKVIFFVCPFSESCCQPAISHCLLVCLSQGCKIPYSQLIFTFK
jgi:hypothetical protein